MYSTIRRRIIGSAQFNTGRNSSMLVLESDSRAAKRYISHQSRVFVYYPGTWILYIIVQLYLMYVNT